MFKIIYRTLIILAAAVLVSYGLIWFSGTSAGQTAFAGGGRGHDRPAFNANTQAGIQPNFTPRQNFRGDFGGGRDGGGVNTTRALGDLPAKIGLIAAITAAVVLARKLLSLLSRKNGPGTAVPA